jgi:N-acetylglucosamine transport system substrate-binding protein
MKKRFAASAMILAMSAATVLSPLTTFAEAEEQELNIAIFQGGYGDAYWNQMVELFEASHEGVKVNMTISPTIGDIIRPQIVAGNAPDFICLNDGGEDGVILSLIKEHALLNLDDVFDGENYAGTGTLRDDITDGILSSTKCAPYGDDEIYLAPFNSGPQGLIYNKTFFDENNLEVPKTWDEFFTLGDKVKDIDGRALFTYQGIYPGYMEEMLWPAIANECGEEALTKIANYEEGSFNNEGVLKALTHIKEIAEKGYLLEGTVGMNHTESQTEMMLGKAAFITNGTWMENEMQDAPREEGFEFAMAPIPTENADDVHYVFDSCEQFSIPAAMHKDQIVSDGIQALSSLLQNTLTNKNEYITIQEELENLENYFSILRIRYAGSFEYSFHVEENEQLSCLVPKLILQPLAENSVMHGSSDNGTVMKIQITCWRENEDVMIELSDDGKGFEVTDDALAPHPERKRIGVANVNDRIQLNFGRKYGLKINSQPGKGTTCTLTLPELYADTLS